MHQRNFDLIRLPDLIGSSFLFNNVKVRYVATYPETGISFYINNGQGGVIGVRVYPDGRKVLVNTQKTKYGKPYAHGKSEYLQFRDAFGLHKGIYASHAVYIAWTKPDPRTECPNMPAQHLHEKIPAGTTIDHIDGCTTNNFIGNLRCISNAINNRDGGFLRKLRKSGIKPTDIRRPYLLRYFDRMAFIKENIPHRRYYHLDRADLMTILFYDLPVVYAHFEKQYHLSLPFKLGLL